MNPIAEPLRLLPEGHHEETDFAVEIGRYDRAPAMEIVRRLSCVDGWRSTRLIAWQWLVIVAAMALAIRANVWWAYLLSGLTIGTRQQALGVLVHDAAHWLLYRNRRVNDWISDLFCGFPVGMSTTLYREAHFRHHRFTSTDRDPDWVMQQADPDWRWPKTRREAWALLFRSVLAINLRSGIKVAMQYSPGARLFSPVSRAYPLDARLVFVALTLVIYAVFGTGLYYRPSVFVPIIVLWIVPFLTLFNFLSRMRATAEHVLTARTHELNSSRTVQARWWERLLIAPLGINFHLEHHLFPSVPGPDLHQLHAALMEDPAFCQRAHVTRGYLGARQGLVGELLTPEKESTRAE